MLAVGHIHSQPQFNSFEFFIYFCLLQVSVIMIPSFEFTLHA